MEKIEKIFKYIQAAVLAIGAAIIYGLLRKNENLRSKVGQLESEKNVNEAIVKKNQAKKEADDAEAEYIRTRDEFLKQLHESSSNEE